MFYRTPLKTVKNLQKVSYQELPNVHKKFMHDPKGVTLPNTVVVINLLPPFPSLSPSLLPPLFLLPPCPSSIHEFSLLGSPLYSSTGPTSVGDCHRTVTLQVIATVTIQSYPGLPHTCLCMDLELCVKLNILILKVLPE